MNKILIVPLAVLTISAAGCAGLIQTGSITKAYETYESQDYPQTLKLITQAENLSQMTPELRAELTYLRAQTFRRLGKSDKANTLFEYLKDQHRDSQYGYLAARRLAER